MHLPHDFRSALRILAVVVVLAAVAIPPLVGIGWADPIRPSASDRQVTLAVTSLLQREHLSRRPLDEEISRRCLASFLKMLDSWKLYFHQSDVDGFMRRQNDLHEMAKKGDVSFAYEVFQTFLKRIDERVAVIDELLAVEHDFTVDEEMLVDRDLATYPRTPEEAREKWRKRIKYDLLVLKADDVDGEEAIEKLRRRYHSFARRMHQTNEEELLEMYLTAMTSSLDPHTTYMSPGTLENFEIQMRLGLEGIGAALQSEDGYVTVNKIIPGGAAERQGELKVGDRIVGVGQGDSGEIVDTVDMKLSDVVQMIRGKADTVVRLVVLADGAVRKEITITRAKIELTDSEARSEIFEAGHKADGSPYKVGVIDLPSFYMDMEGARRGLPDFKSTTRDVRKILENFKRDGVDAVVLDLRRNGGGSLTEAINLTGMFIDQGPIVQVKDAEGRVQPYPDLEPGMVWSGPLVVLVSKFSASASEILAGAVQDYGRGLVVGDRATHGKGTVQSLVDLGQRLFRIPSYAPSLGALKITMQQFYRPSGDSTQKRGVLSDIELPSLTTHLDVGEADLDFPMEFDRVEPANFLRMSMVSQALNEQLRRNSQERIAQSPDFQRVLQNIERYKEQKARKYITLNEEKFLKERAELNAEREQQKQIEELNEGSRNGIRRDYYLDEAIAITLDYLRGLQQIAQSR
jgi:carboxyl-terminal processing protease